MQLFVLCLHCGKLLRPGFVCGLDPVEEQCILNKGRPTWCHLFYYVNFLLNMFRMLIQPSSGACNYLVCYCMGCIVLAWGVLVCSGLAVGDVVSDCGSTCIQIPHHQQPIRYTPTRLKPAQYSPCSNTPSSCKLLKMVVLTSETCWAENWHNKISDIKLVYLYSTIKMMHGPIRIRTVYFI